MAIDFAARRLGIAFMDEDHQALADLFSAFELCFREKRTEQSAGKIVEEALLLAQAHFEREEKAMEEQGFPAASEHKFFHRSMRLEFSALMADTLAHAAALDPVTLEHLDLMRQRIKEHIDGPDAALAQYLKSRSG